MLRGVKAWLRFLVWPSFPWQILDVVYPDRIETYYDGYDEIRVFSSKKGYAITVIPRESRSDAPGPISFISSHDPWSVGVLVTPFFIFRQIVILWAITWFILVYFIFLIGFNALFTPPLVEANVPGYGRIAIPKPGWTPNPVDISIWILLIGFTTMYYVFHVFRFIQSTIKYSTLMVIGSVSGVYYAVPAPEPLTAIKASDFLKLLGHKLRVFELETVETLMGVLTAVLKENTATREQAIECLEGYRRLTELQDIGGEIVARREVLALMTRKPLLFILMITVPLAIGIILGMMLGGGVSIEPAP